MQLVQRTGSITGNQGFQAAGPAGLFMGRWSRTAVAVALAAALVAACSAHLVSSVRGPEAARLRRPHNCPTCVAQRRVVLPPPPLVPAQLPCSSLACHPPGAAR